MLNIVCTTDPITGKDLRNLPGLPYIEQRGRETDLRIYFESETSKQVYLDVPVEHPLSELPVNLDNPTGEMVDEG